MKIQEWIAEGQYSSSVVRRSLSFFLKTSIEGIVFLIVGFIFAAFTFVVQKVTPISIPQLPESTMALWVLFTVVVGHRGYCFLTEKDEG